MKKQERAQLVRKVLNRLIPHPEVPLRHQSNYQLLVAVLLSARCTDARVNQITPTLFARAATPKAMAELSVEEIRSIIRPCGLSPTKARAIHQLSKIIHEEYQDRVPSTLEELEELPGVGHKTASVVMVQAFHQPAFPVDTHIHRCAKRWGLSSGTTRERTERDLKELFPKRSWGKIHLQIILYARQYCPALRHKLASCPICAALHSAESADH
jgi:endonuclease III